QPWSASSSSPCLLWLARPSRGQVPRRPPWLAWRVPSGRPWPAPASSRVRRRSPHLVCELARRRPSSGFSCWPSIKLLVFPGGTVGSCGRARAAFWRFQSRNFGAVKRLRGLERGGVGGLDRIRADNDTGLERLIGRPGLTGARRLGSIPAPGGVGVRLHRAHEGSRALGG